MRLELVSYKYIIVIQHYISLKNKTIDCLVYFLSLSLSLSLSLNIFYGGWLPQMKSTSLQFLSIPIKNHRVPISVTFLELEIQYSSFSLPPRQNF